MHKLGRFLFSSFLVLLILATSINGAAIKFAQAETGAVPVLQGSGCLPEIGSGAQGHDDVSAAQVVAEFCDAYQRNLSFIGKVDDSKANGQVHTWAKDQVTDPSDYQIQDFTGHDDLGAKIIYSPQRRRAFVVRGSILQTYLSTRNDEGGGNGVRSWLGGPISDEEDTPRHYYLHNGRISRFDKGFIARDRNGNYTAHTYYPEVCDVNVSIQNAGPEWLVNVNAYVDRAPGWLAGDESDPTIVRAFHGLAHGETWGERYEGENRIRLGPSEQLFPENGSLTRFSGSFTRPKGYPIWLVIEAENRRGVDGQGWVPKKGGYPVDSTWLVLDFLEIPEAEIHDGYTENFGACRSDLTPPGGDGSGPLPPVAIVSADRFSVDVGQSTQVNDVHGRASYDRDRIGCGALSYVWQIVAPTDGPFPRNGNLYVGQTFTGPQLNFIPASGDMGGWKFRLTVTDDEGQQGYTDFYITVREPDKDGDGLSDLDELVNGTDRTDADTDNDGLSDGEELQYTTSPGIFGPYYYRSQDFNRSSSFKSENSHREYGDWGLKWIYDYRQSSQGSELDFKTEPQAYRQPKRIIWALQCNTFGPEIKVQADPWGEAPFKTDWRKSIDTSIVTSIYDFPYQTGQYGGDDVGLTPSPYLNLHIASTLNPVIALPIAMNSEADIDITVKPVGGKKDFSTRPPSLSMAYSEESIKLVTTKIEAATLEVKFGGGLEGPLGGTWGLGFANGRLSELKVDYVEFSFVPGSYEEDSIARDIDYNYGHLSLTNIPLVEADQYHIHRKDSLEVSVPLNMIASSTDSDSDIVEVGLDVTIKHYTKDGEELSQETCQAKFYMLVLRSDYDGGAIGYSPMQALALKSYSNYDSTASAPGRKWQQSQIAPTTVSTIIGNYQDQAIDANGDGLFDTLDFTFQVASNQAYLSALNAQLYNGTKFVASTIKLAPLITGTQTVSLSFDALPIFNSNINGTLSLRELELAEYDGAVLDTYSSPYTTTTVYQSNRFKGPGAVIHSVSPSSGIDTDGDTYYDCLRLPVRLDVSEPGSYRLQGSLFTLDGQSVAAETSNLNLSAGSQTINVDFDGLEIQASKLDGPYIVQNLELLNDAEIMDSKLDVYTTTNLSYSQFQRPVLEPAADHSDKGIDTDENGKFNFLEVNLGLDINKSGNYELVALLENSLGQIIRFTTEDIALTGGHHNIALLFDGITIGEMGINGPYYLTQLDVRGANSHETLIKYYDVYITAAYLASDFENSYLQQPQLAYVDGTTLVLNMGSEARRNARGIASNVIDEEFTVQQLSETLPGTFSVSAFGLTQVYSGASTVLAEADDGNDVVTLESGTDQEGNFIPFTAPATIDGGSGDDLIFSGGGDDTLSGGTGEDNIWGGAGDDDIIGNEGDDVLHGGGGDDTLTGDAGDDTLMGDQGMDTLYGDVALTCSDAGTVAGNDQLFGGPDNDSLYGGAGADVIVGEAGDDTLCGNGGDDFLDGDYEDVAPTDGHDQLYGGPGDDTLSGRGGEDTLLGDEGNDTLSGDAGNDTLYGSSADDQVDGGPGDDYLEGNQGMDTLDGGEGQDDLIGGSSTATTADAGDILFGGPGHDVILGDSGTITRPEGTDAADGAVIRHVTLFDLTSADPALSGPDEIHGNEGNDELYGAGNDDTLHGDDGDDYIEGNLGSDSLFGDGGQDDMIGGSSAGPDGVAGGGVYPTHVADGDDTMRGGPDSDVMLGDNGTITRPVDGAGSWTRLHSDKFDIVIRSVRMAQTPDQAGAFGNDTIQGDDGHDEMYGQLGHDYMKGSAGEDAMVGDLGLITSNIEDSSREELIRPQPPFIEATIFKAGTLSRLVELYAFQTGESGEGNDIMLGGNDQDNIHGGPGNDLMNGNAGEDHLFGGDGDDVMWGGPDQDHLWGGYGDDHLDVLPRDEIPADPPEWFTYGWLDNYQDIDYIYGGWGQDAMQADIADQGPVPGDRLIDWVGAYNVYYLCPGLYGEFVITRNHSPHVMQFLQQLAEGDGAFNPDASGTSGFREVAMVFPKDIKHNSHPPHTDHPGHFTCGAPDPLLSYIVISPDTATIKAGEDQTYAVEAFGAHDNSLGDVTEDTTFSIVENGHGGSWVDSTYTAAKAGQWTVQASFVGREARCSLTVEPNVPAQLALSADPTTVPADGESTAVITATVTDAWGNLVADGTSVTFSTTAGTLGTDTALTQDGLVTTTLTSARMGGVAVVTVTAGEVQEIVEVGFEMTATEKPIYLPLIWKH